jgi:hypothetical protein
MIGTGNVLNTYGMLIGKYIADREPFIHRVGCLIKRLHLFFTQVDFIQLLVAAVAYTDLHVFTQKIISTLNLSKLHLPIFLYKGLVMIHEGRNV